MNLLLIVIVIGLLLVLILSGIDAGLQNVATAKQAQAQIETARAAQIASLGNVLIIVLVVLAIVALLALVGYVAYRRVKRATRRVAVGLPVERAPAIGNAPDLGQLTQVLLLKVLSDLARADDLRVPRFEEHPQDTWRDRP